MKKRKAPVVEVRAMPRIKKVRRPIGLAKNKIKISNKFFDPLPSDLLDGFEGKP